MGFVSKLVGAGLGFVLGGPVGAVIGFFIGSAFSGNQQEEYTSTNRRHATEGDFKVSLLVLIACVMKADGNVKRSELDVVKRFLLRNYTESDALEALQILKKLLEQPINETEVAMQIGQYMNYSTKLELVHLLLDIAYADGGFSSAEMAVINRIANIFRLSTADFDALCALYNKQQDADWMYKALQITPDVSDDEVKKAYRKMAMKYHPDKVASAGEEAKQSATEKFRQINEAYEAIKKARGMK